MTANGGSLSVFSVSDADRGMKSDDPVMRPRFGFCIRVLSV